MSYFYDPKKLEVKYCDLRQARKNGYYPSLTTVLKMAYSEGLERWKDDQIIEACIDSPFHLNPEWVKKNGVMIIEYKKENAITKYKLKIKKLADKKSKIARDTGITVHSAIETYLKQGFRITKIKDPQIAGMFLSAKTWIDENIKEIFEVEYICCDDKLKIGCRLDFLGSDKSGRYIIIDFKTQNVKKNKPVFYKSMIAQLMGQKLACPVEIDELKNIIISSIPNEDGEYKIYESNWTKNEIKDGLNYLKSVRKLYEIDKNI